MTNEIQPLTRADVQEIVDASAQKIMNEFSGILQTALTMIGSRFDEIDRRFEVIDERFDKVDQRFENIEARLDKMDKRFDRIENRLDRIEIRIDRIETSIADHRQQTNAMERKLDAVISLVDEHDIAIQRLYMRRAH